MKTKFFLTTIAIGLVGSLVACSSANNGNTEPGSPTEPDANPAAEEVFVGIVNSYTGFTAAWGPSWEAGFRAGIDDLTEGTGVVDGVKIRIEVADDASDPATGQNAAKELLGAGAQVIAGTSSSAIAVPVSQLAEQNDRVFIGGGTTTTALAGSGDGVFVSQVDSYVVNNAVLSVIEANGGTRVAYLGQDYAYGQTASEALKIQGEPMGIEVIPFLLPPTTTDFTAGIAQVMDADVDTIYVGWMGEGQTQLYQTLGAQGGYSADSNKKVLAVAPLIQSFESVAEAVGEEGLKNLQLVTTWAPGVTGNDAEKVVIATGENSDVPVDTQQAAGYIGAQLLVKAIKEHGADLSPANFHAAVTGKEFEAPQGMVSIRAEDHMLLAPLFEFRLEPKDGGYHLVKIQEFSADKVAFKVGEFS